MTVLAEQAKLPRNSIRQVLMGHEPKLNRAVEIAQALDIELHLGPRRSVPHSIARALDLEDDCTAEDVVREIERVKKWDSAKWAALMERTRKQTEAQLEASSREIEDKIFRIIDEYKLTDPSHLKNAPLHAIPFATEVRETGRPEEVEFVEAAEGIAVERSAIAGWAEWKHLICMQAPGDTMVPRVNEGDLIILDRSKREPVRGTEFVFLVLSGDSLSLRRLRESDGVWWLYSDNPLYQRRRLGGGHWLLGAVAGIAGQNSFSFLPAARRRARSKK